MSCGFRFESPLYPIVDTTGRIDDDAVGRAAALLAAGARLLQLRAKGVPSGQVVDLGREIGRRCRAAGARFIVNDRTDIAQLVAADGVHLGQEDLPPAAARRLLGPGKIIGVSTHDPEQAEAALREGVADYLGFGPIFATTSKTNPDPVVGLAGLRRVRQLVSLPLVAIGGIDASNAAEVRAAGADAVAMIGGLTVGGDVGAAMQRVLARMGQG